MTVDEPTDPSVDDHSDRGRDARAPADGAPTRVPSRPEDFPPTGPNSLASIGRRIAARLIDAAILLVPVALVLLDSVGDLTDDSGQLDPDLLDVGLGTLLLAALLPVVYETVFIAWRGATPGKAIMGLRVASVADGGNPPLAMAAIRVLVPTVIGAIPIPGFDLVAIMSYVVAIWHPLRRGWHDRAAATVVVSTR